MGYRLFRSVLERFPDRQSMLRMYGVAVFLTYGWTLLVSFWKLPSWLYFLRLSEIFAVYAYSFLVNFTESVLLGCAFLFMGAVLPVRWWRDNFVSRSVVAMLVLFASILLGLRTYSFDESRAAFVESQPSWWAWSIGIAILTGWLLSGLGWLRRGVEDFAERTIVFLYMYLPLTVISLLVIVFRNI